MTIKPYPHLGWNPVPGIPEEVDALRARISKSANALSNAHSRIEHAVGELSYWEGDAANAFRASLDGDFSIYLKNAAHSLEKAAKQLSLWRDDLTSYRDLARKYDTAAAEHKEDLSAAMDRHSKAEQNPDLKLVGQQFSSQAELENAQSRVETASSELNSAATAMNSAQSALDDVIAKAKHLETTHSDQAEKIARALDDATDKLAPKQGWLSKSLDSIKDGIKKAGAFLLEHAGTIGAIAGLLALFPTPLTPLFAGIAFVASAASMGKNLTDPKFRGALVGEGSGWDTFSAYASLAGDAVGMVPGVGALGRAGKEVAEAAETAGRWGVAVSHSEKATEFMKDIVPAFSRSATEAADEGTAALVAGSKAAASRIAEISVNGVNVSANLDSSAESLGLKPQEGTGHNITESTKAAVTLHGIAGLMGFA